MIDAYQAVRRVAPDLYEPSPGTPGYGVPDWLYEGKIWNLPAIRTTGHMPDSSTSPVRSDAERLSAGRAL